MGDVRSSVPPRRRPKAEEFDAGDPDGATLGVALGGLPQHLGYALRRAQLAVFADFITTLEKVNLRPGEYSVLTLIAENPGILARRICRTLGIQPANFVTLFGRLESRGIVRRVAIDRRSNGLYLTAKGRTLLARAHILGAEHERKIADKIGRAECQRLIELLFRIADLDGDSTADAPSEPTPVAPLETAAPAPLDDESDRRRGPLRPAQNAPAVRSARKKR
jgi:DNA-binding MarR family transcriptional regulator